jgi:hypothetical protein
MTAETIGAETTRELSYIVFIRATTIAAVFDIVPNSSPLLAPRKRALANLTDFFGQVLFFYSTHIPKTTASIKGLPTPLPRTYLFFTKRPPYNHSWLRTS